MIVDSHVHLHLIDYKKLKSKLDDIIKLAYENQVNKQLCVATNIYQFKEIMFICNKYKNIYGSIGIHPNEKYTKEDNFNVERLVVLSKNDKIKAIGETGLDYYYNTKDRINQIKRFEQHIEASILSKLPLIIHARNAKYDILNVLNHYKNYNIKGVLHCFSEDLDMAKKLIDLGFMISFSGIITFKNDFILKNIVKKIPIESFIVETDSPYLAPNPYRGKINQPSYVVNIINVISKLTNKSFKSISNITTENFRRLFLF